MLTLILCLSLGRADAQPAGDWVQRAARALGWAAPAEGLPAAPPARPSRESRLALLEERVIADGVRPEASQEVKRLLSDMLEGADDSVVANLAAFRTWIVIVPSGRRLTDLPQFRALRGQITSLDTRHWDDVRGLGEFRLPDGSGVAVAVPEENLLGDGMDEHGYPKRFEFVHEYAHIVHLYGLPQKDSPISFAAVANLFHALISSGGTGLGDYADSDSREFFAQAAAVYFGIGQHGESLRALSKPTLQLFSRIFGPVKPLDRRV